MLKRTVFIVTLAAFAAVLTTTAVPAVAEIHVKFSANSLHLDYDWDGSTGDMDITSQNTDAEKTTAKLSLYDTVADTTPDRATLTTAITNSDTFILDLTVQMVSGIWQATGTWTMNDTNGEAIKASFFSADIKTVEDWQADPAFVMTGTLTPFESNEAILLGTSGSDWEFVGNADGGENSDGKDDTITIGNWGSYNGGTMVTTHFLLGAYQDTDSFLQRDHLGNTGPTAGMALDGGWASGTIVPVPAAVVLGFIGLGMVGWRMRKYA